MYQLSPGGPKRGPTTVPKWDGKPLENLLKFENDLLSARKAAREYQLLRGAENTLHWQPVHLPEELLAKHEVFGFFVPKPDWDEPQSLESLLSNTKSPNPVVVCLPRIDAESGAINFYEIRDPAKDLIMNKKFGILEPRAVPRRKRFPTLLVVPCLMADHKGQRIGRGGGFYDRYLASHPEVRDRVGVLHSTSVIERGIPEHWLKDHDQELTALITEKEFFAIQQSLRS